MVKKFTTFAVVALAIGSANAELLVKESFDYNPGDLTTFGSWLANGSAGAYEINIIEENLIYPGYQEDAIGNAVCLDKSMGKNSAQNIFALSKDNAPESAAYSALVKVNELQSTSRFGAVLVLVGSNSYDDTMGDGIVSSEGCGLYIKQGSEEGKAIFGVSVKGSANGLMTSDISWSEEEIAVGETVLVVLTYDKQGADYVAGLYINQTDESAQPAAVSTTSAEIEPTLVDIRGIALCQRSALTSKNPEVVVDELRVATEWSDLFSGDQGTVTMPIVNVSVNPLDFDQVYGGFPYSRSIIVKGSDLTSDITLKTETEGRLVLSTDKISIEEAMSENGFELIVSLVPDEYGYVYDKITLQSDNAADRVVNVQWRALPFEGGETSATIGLQCSCSEGSASAIEFVAANAETGDTAHYLATIQSDNDTVDIEIMLPDGYDTMYSRQEEMPIAVKAVDSEAGAARFSEGKVLTFSNNGTTQKHTIVFGNAGVPDVTTATELRIKAGVVSAVNEVEIEDAEAEYYSIDGVRTNNPGKGLYIVKHNGKIRKVLF